jgi:hypothetical protein
MKPVVGFIADNNTQGSRMGMLVQLSVGGRYRSCKNDL